MIRQRIYTTQHTAASNHIYYEQHQPKEIILYQLVQEHIETFFAQVETKTGSGLPYFVKYEFDAFLECGILAHGFLRLRCADYAYEKPVAFSFLFLVWWAAHAQTAADLNIYLHCLVLDNVYRIHNGARRNSVACNHRPTVEQLKMLLCQTL